MINSYKDLIVWQRGIDLVTAVYDLTRQFPPDERFGLVSQMQRAAVSIPSNIAEGRYRVGKEKFSWFLRVSYASGAELETQIIIAKKLYQTKNLNYAQVDSLLNEVMKMLNSMLLKLEAN